MQTPSINGDVESPARRKSSGVPKKGDTLPCYVYTEVFPEWSWFGRKLNFLLQTVSHERGGGLRLRSHAGKKGSCLGLFVKARGVGGGVKTLGFTLAVTALLLQVKDFLEQNRMK